MTRRARQRSIATRRTGLLLIPLLLGLTLALFPLLGQETNPQTEYSLFNRGSVSYQRYCSNCHGAKAKGDGQIARLLKVQPADLTQLSVNNGGEFPEEEVRQTIDGRKGALGHGPREMPIWGQVFLDGGEGPEAEAKVRTKIDELVAYLKGIQEK